jgi:hypothetical protein
VSAFERVRRERVRVVSAFVLVMALVAISYFAGLFGAGRSIRGLGLPSGIEWVLVGVVLGPDLLGVIDHAVQTDVEPIVFVAVGWLALVLGVDYGVIRRRRLRPGRIALGLVAGTITLAAVGGAVWLAAPHVPLFAALPSLDRLVLALGAGAVATESTSNAIRWVAERHGARGPLSELLDDLAEAKDAAPILAAGVAVCLRPSTRLHDAVARALPAQPLVLFGWALGTGLVLGAAAAILLRKESRTEQRWGILVGSSLLAVGAMARLGLPVVMSLFALGLAVGLLSRHRDQISSMIDPTRRGALLPALLLAGARLEPGTALAAATLIAIALAARAAAVGTIGLAVGRGARLLAGPAMLSSGELSIAIGLSLALAVPGPIGETLLALAVAGALVGELIGPVALRAALRRAGEIGQAASSASRESGDGDGDGAKEAAA